MPVTPSVFGLPNGGRPTPYYRGYGQGYVAGASGTINVTLSPTPLPTSQLVLLGGGEKWTTRGGLYNLSQAGYDWPATLGGEHVTRGYPNPVVAVGRRNTSIPSAAFSVYSESYWSGVTVMEFPGIIGEVLYTARSWNGAGTSVTVTVPASQIREPNLLIVAVGVNDTGGGGPDGVTAGWNGSSAWLYNYITGWKVNPPVGVAQSCTFSCSSRGNTLWSAAAYVIR